MKICIAAPVATCDVAPYLDEVSASTPAGYGGAPLTGVLIGELLRRGYDVAAVTVDGRLPKGADAVRLTGRGFEFRVLPGRRRAWRPNGLQPGRALDFNRVERRLIAEAIVDCAPDIVHAHWTYEFALGALDSGLPLLVTCHDAPGAVLRYTRSPYRALRYLMARKVLRTARHLTAVSPYMADAAHRLGGKGVTVIPNPLADYALDEGGPRPPASTRRIALIAQGMQRRKNVETALQAFALYRAGEPAAELHLFGLDLGAGESAQRYAERQRIGGGMHFHGPLPHRELIARLTAMDVLLHPALEESFGVVIAEAMALGLPVVAGASSGAVPWVVGPLVPEAGCAPGVLTDVQSAPRMCAALIEAFDERYAERSALAVARARSRFSPQTVVDQYLAQYDRVLGTARRPDIAALPQARARRC